jgi:hypothetical protein
LTPVPPPEKNAPPADTPADPARRARLADLLTELRLGVDLGEIRTPAAFRALLERDGTFTSDDPLVRSTCASAGLAAWLVVSSG